MDAVVDSSSLISLSESCLIKVFEKLSKNLNMNFFIPKSVEMESVQRPLYIKRFELNAIRIKMAIDENWVKALPYSIELHSSAMELAEMANNCFFARGKPLALLQLGETESLALLKKLNSNVLVIDERTARLLVEDPLKLRDYIGQKFGEKIRIDSENLESFRKSFQGIQIFRSTELIALAFEKGYLNEEIPSGEKALEAALYAAKFSGCAVSFDEIKTFLGKK